MERSFAEEVGKLKLGDGETFHGEGILAVTKALLQSGVSYVGGYQGAPVSHMMDVLNDAPDIMDELGVQIETRDRLNLRSGVRSPLIAAESGKIGRNADCTPLACPTDSG